MKYAMGTAAATMRHEACPLCLQHYHVAEERCCAVCDAHSCARCVEEASDGSGVRCFACGPYMRPSVAA